MIEKYEINDLNLKIIDSQMGIDLESNLQIEKKYLYYEDRKVMSIMHYHKNVLHGPSLFYLKNGNLLSSTWFYEGKRYGKAYQYYNSSKLYSVNRYIADNLEGQQIYYYENGNIRTIMTYKNGNLDGEVKLFYDNSKLKRFLIFENGKKNHDNIFDENEKIIDEQSFSL